MKSYYTGKHTVQYNRTWKHFLQRTLEATCSAIDVEWLRQNVQKPQHPLRILDAACGTGVLLERLIHLFPSAELYGVDASEEMLDQAQRLLQGYSNVHLWSARLSGEARAGLPYPPAFFDLITCTNTLHYLQEPAAVLRGFKNLLTGQGQLVLEDYTLRSFPLLWKAFDWAIRAYDPEHRSLFSQEEAQHLCQQVSLQVVTAQTFPVDLICQGWVLRAI